MDVSIEVEGDYVYVDAPYDEDFIKGVRSLRGKWDKPYWVFDARDEDRIRSLCLKVYGDNGIAADKLVTVRIDAEKYDKWPGQEIRIAGRALVRRMERDRAVQLAPRTHVVEGAFKSRGGSRKNPRIEKVEGVVLEVRDIPLSVAAKMQEDAGSAFLGVVGEDLLSSGLQEMVRQTLEYAVSQGMSTEALRAEVERCTASS